jgi:16S rRNA (cytosine967-C5)-methyltransferase
VAKWHINPERMKELQSLQFQILQKNAALVKKGGKLIYATCSIFPSENSEQIQAFLNSEAGKRFTLKREETLLAHQTGFDGFFIAELSAE